MSQLEFDNQFPDCVLLKIHGACIKRRALIPFIKIIGLGSQFKIKEMIELFMTLRFGKQKIKVPGGHIWFGIKRGDLGLKLKNGRIPLERMGLVSQFQMDLYTNEVKEKGQDAEANLAMTPGIRTRSINRFSTNVQYRNHQILTRGTEKEPIWEFETKTKEVEFLSGQLTEVSLGRVEVKNVPCTLRAKFTVRGQRDIHLIEAEGLWARDISRNKRALLERKFFLQFIASKLQPYLSQVKGQL